MIDLSILTIKSAREGLKNKTFTSRELTEASIEVIKNKDGEIHAFLEVFSNALTQADEADKKISIPDDASLALLLFAYQAAGGQFKDLRLTFLKEKFTKRGETLFDYLSIDGKEVNEDLKATIKGIKDTE